DQHEWNLLHLRVSNLRSDFFTAKIRFNSEARFAELTRDFFCIFIDPVRNRQHCYLHGTEPQRKDPSVVFDKDAEEALHGTEQRTVNHKRSVRLVVFTDVLKLESLGKIEIKLHRRQFPVSANRIFNTNVDFWPVENCFTFHPLVRDALVLKCIGKSSFGAFPIFIRSQIMSIRIATSNRQFNFDILEPKDSIKMISKVDAPQYFFSNGLRRTENVGIVLSEPAHSRHPVKRS